MDTVSHVAGPSMNIRGRIIQRCMVCGEKLCDSKNTASPLNEGGSVPEFPTWCVGDIVQTSVNENPRRYIRTAHVDDGGPIEEDCCIALVED